MEEKRGYKFKCLQGPSVFWQEKTFGARKAGIDVREGKLT